MEGGSTSSSSKTRACLTSVVGLGGINNNSSSSNNNNNNINVDTGLSSMMMVNNSSAAGTSTGNGKPFLLPPWNANSSTSCDGQRVVPPIFMPQVHHSSEFSNSMKAKIMAHPQFPRLLAAYVNCQKVGAPPEVVTRLEESCASGEAMNWSAGTGCVGEDPALDQFMEAYCEMLIKYEQELTKPIKETLLFLSKIESQLKDLTLPSNIPGQNGSSEEEIDFNDSYIDPLAEDGELKGLLLRKYSGCLGNLKQEFLKKKKKGKLPKEARHQLLEWWNRHYKWPYPSESQKQMLAESTGLDAKQINNWFINQRKRHWRPSEDMQFVMMDAAAYPQYYMENLMGNPIPMDCTPARIGLHFHT